MTFVAHQVVPCQRFPVGLRDRSLGDQRSPVKCPGGLCYANFTGQAESFSRGQRFRDQESEVKAVKSSKLKAQRSKLGSNHLRRQTQGTFVEELHLSQPQRRSHVLQLGQRLGVDTVHESDTGIFRILIADSLTVTMAPFLS